MTTVLVVEDEVDVLEIVQEALEERGFRVRTAADDKAAFRILETEAESLNLLVTDINLGVGVTGFDVARRARELRPDLKVIYITGHAAHLDRFGVTDAVIVPKPFYPAALADQVVEVLQKP